MFKSFFRALKSRLLLPILVTVLVVIGLQVLISLLVTQRSVDVLVDEVLGTLVAGDKEIAVSLDRSRSEIGLAIDNLSLNAEEALNTTLTQQLGEEKKQVESLLVESVQDTAKAMANLMALASPNAIWDGDSPTLTRLVSDLHRNEMVLFARYYDIDGKPLTRHLDKRKPVIKQLIAAGEGRRTFDKVLSAARKDPSVYVVEVDINPRGAVIGRFILGVSNVKAREASEALSQRFNQLIANSKENVRDAVTVEAQVASQAVTGAIAATNQISENTSKATRIAIDDSSDQLISDLSIVLVALGALIIVLLTLVFSSRVVSKINLLIDGLKELAEGEGDLTRQIDIRCNNEIGDMAAAVNQFITKTRDLVIQTNQAAEQVTSHLRDLNQGSLSADGAMGRQEEKMEQVAVAMSEMVDTIQQVAERIQGNLMNVDAIRGAANDASNISTDVRLAITNMEQEVKDAAQTVDNVSSLSAQIESVLDIINGVAEQTNLLALNAAIEAARAGDSGRGFAVVADEVRSLASKTQHSTESIHNQIAELQSGVSNAVNVISRACDQAQQGIASINRSDQQIQGMTTSIQSLFDLTNDIAAMAEQQSQVSESINHSLTDVNHETKVTSEAVSSNSNLVLELDQTVGELKQTLGRFKV
ncbi:MAG: methyl-accepting chemotaxis protein [Amphritea sp.]